MIHIIGGGVFGLAIGWRLAQVGQAVTILEKDQVGRGATWAAAGMLMPWKLSDGFNDALFALQRASHERWPTFAEAVERAGQVELDYQTAGRYFVALMDKAATRLRRQYDFHRHFGFPVEWLSGQAARSREPNLGPRVLAAIYTSLAHHVDNRQLVTALCRAFRQAGGVLHEQTRVVEIVTGAGRVQGVRTATAFLPSDTVILAAGAWSGQIPGLPQDLSGLVRPRKGQTLMLQMSSDEPLLRQPVLGPVYLVPRADGRLVVGTTVEREAGFDNLPTVSGIYHILRKARNMVPRVTELAVVEMSAGLRPTGPARLPVLGPTAVEGLLMATGGHSYGILLTPIVAESISHLALTGQTAPLIAPFRPGQHPQF